MRELTVTERRWICSFEDSRSHGCSGWSLISPSRTRFPKDGSRNVLDLATACSVLATIGYLVDTHMMAMFGAARERTESEFRELLQCSGFVLGRAIETASPVWIMEAMPA